MAQYHYLVSSLREYAFDGTEKDFFAGEIRAYVHENLDESDAALLDLFHTCYDIENIAGVTTGSNRFNDLGNFSLEQLEEEVKKPALLPGYIARVLEAYADQDGHDDEVDTSRRMERSLYEAFYAEAARSNNRFIREWFDFDRTLRNICAAVAAHKAGRAVEDVVVGNDTVTAALARNMSGDFGLKGEVEDIDQIVAIVIEEPSLLERERRLDMMRWKKVEDLTTFSYFDMDAVLGYMAKVNIIQRWRVLNPAVGREMFGSLKSALSGQELFEWIARKEEENN